MLVRQHPQSPAAVQHERLLRAINDIVGAKFDTSLKALKTTLVQDDESSFRIWAALKPCQLEPLLILLMNRLHEEQDALEIFASLICIPIVRQAVARCNAELVQASLTKVAGTTEDPELLTATALALIDLPGSLRHTSTLLVSLLNRLLSNELGHTEQQWLSNISDIFSVIKIEHLTAASDEALRASFTKWKALLRSEDHSIALRCLSISQDIFRLAQTSLSFGELPLVAWMISSALQQWFDTASRLFMTDKAASVLQSTVLRVIYFCSEGPAVPMHEVLHCLDLATKVCNAIGDAIRACWVAANPAVMQKLMQKTSRDDLDPLLQSSALIFLENFELIGHESVLRDMALRQITSITSSPSIWMYANIKHHNALIVSLLSRLKRCNEQLSTGNQVQSVSEGLKKIADFVVEHCQPCLTADAFHNASGFWAWSIMQVLHASYCDPPFDHIVQELAYNFTSQPLPDWWSLDIAVPRSPLSCDAMTSCFHRSESDRQSLCSSVTKFILATSSMSNRMLSPHNFALLVAQMMGRSSAKEPYECIYPASERWKTMAPIALAQSEPDIDWQTNMVQQMTNLSRQTTDLINREVRLACHDLQERCDNVERPLRTATALVEEMEMELDQKQQEVSGLHTTVEALQTAKATIHDELLAEQKRKADLSSKCAGLEHDLRETENKLQIAQQDLSTAELSCKDRLVELEVKAKEDQDVLELGHKAEVFGLHEQIFELHSKADTMESKHNRLKDELADTRLQLENLDNKLYSVYREQDQAAAKQTKQLEENESKIKEQSVEIAALNTALDESEQVITTRDGQIEALRNQVVLLTESERDWQTKAQATMEELEQARMLEQKIMTMLVPQTRSGSVWESNSAHKERPLPPVNDGVAQSSGSHQSTGCGTDDLHVTPLKV